MRIELTAEQMKLQEEFSSFVCNEIMPYAGQNDREECTPGSMIEKIAQKGYLGAMLPTEYGGLEYDNITLGLLNEEFGKGCSSARSLLTVHGMVALAILRWGTEAQKNYWLPRLAKGECIAAFALTEPNVGSDAKSIETTAVLSGNNYIINGKKKWITMGQVADLFLLFAQYEGKPTAFLVEKSFPGFSVKPIKGLMGAKASMIAELTLENCVVPAENLVGKEGTGLSHVALFSLDYGRYTIAWGCVGAGQACVDESVKYARRRKQFGVALRQHQLIQKMVTEMVVEVKAARMLCYNAGSLKDCGDPDSIMETWVAKYFASKMIGKVAGDAVQIHGANGFSSEYSVERHFRDAKMSEIIEGTSQMHEVLIAVNAFRNV